MIPYASQLIDEEDLSNVIDVLKADFLTQGPVIKKFEKSVAEKVNAKFGVAVNSATSALHIAYKSLGLKKGDYLWTSPNTFAATTNSALNCQARVDFVDINPKTYNICPQKLSDKLNIAKANGKLPKIVVPVHFAGQSCDMKSIYNLSKEYNFKIVEDASHAIGGKYFNKPIGSCEYSDITVFSFHPVKIITCGEGGMALTNSSEIYKKLSLYRSHGITSEFNNKSDFPKEEIWNYQQIDLGNNFRMTDILAALGLSQLSKLESFVKRRNQIANIYGELLKDLPLTLPFIEEFNYSSFHLYPIRINKNKAGINQKSFYKLLKDKLIKPNVHYIPVYRHPFYANLGFEKDYCTEAESYYKETISLPMFPALTDENINYVCDVIKDILNKYV